MELSVIISIAPGAIADAAELALVVGALADAGAYLWPVRRVERKTLGTYWHYFPSLAARIMAAIASRIGSTYH